jgi:hypothetical protein
MNWMRALTLRLSLLLVLFPGACRPGIIVDDWGPPAGYSAVEGTLVRRDTGVPVAAAEITITRCDGPIGLFGSARSTADGGYRITGTLPPIGVLPRLNLDTLHVRCQVFVNRSSTAVDSVALRFFRTPNEVVAHRLDLQLP